MRSQRSALTEESPLSKKEHQALARRRAENRRQAIMWNIIVLGGLGLFLVIVVSYTIYNMRPGPLPRRNGDSG